MNAAGREWSEKENNEFAVSWIITAGFAILISSYSTKGTLFAILILDQSNSSLSALPASIALCTRLLSCSHTASATSLGRRQNLQKAVQAFLLTCYADPNVNSAISPLLTLLALLARGVCAVFTITGAPQD